MYKLSFVCEVITPLFLAGADPFGEPEFRVASLRGAMRYWYRALLGGSNLLADGQDASPLEKLRDLEAMTFGDVNQASPVSITVSAKGEIQASEFKRGKAVLTKYGDYSSSGRDYLFWSMVEFGRPGTERYRPARKYIKPGSQFIVTFSIRNLSNRQAMQSAIAAFWLLAHFGGLGSRARRGAGSFEVVTPPENSPIAFKKCDSIYELCNYLSEGILNSFKLIGGQPRHFDQTPEYDILAPNAAEIWVVGPSPKGWKTSEEALEEIGSALRDFRSHHSEVGKADHDGMLMWLSDPSPPSTKTPPQIKRAIFGLPLPFRYSEGGPSDVIVAEGAERRASPLHIRIARTTIGYFGVLTLFKSQFLAKRMNLRLRTRKWELPAPKDSEDYSVILNFIDSFREKRKVDL